MHWRWKEVLIRRVFFLFALASIFFLLGIVIVLFKEG
ncbi:phosphate ABC transporter permease subunit PstC, partial [candidate division KSB1 bacterium]